MNKLKHYVFILLIAKSSIGITDDINNENCEYIINKMSTAKNINGHLMKEYIESCDLSKVSKLADDAIETMQKIINEKLKSRKDK